MTEPRDQELEGSKKSPAGESSPTLSVGLTNETLDMGSVPSPAVVESTLDPKGENRSVSFDLSEISDRYRVLSVIGEGGMGKIYRAEQIQLGREVAIKVMKSPDDTDAIQRFIMESSITAKLDHPHIVKIHDFGRLTTGAMYLVMELIDGVSMRQYIGQNGTLDLDNALRIAIQLAGAMAEAHKHNIVHRDLKPGNILIMEKPGIGLMAKIIDFGLVKNLAQTANISTTGLIVGSPMFMAPEQITAKKIDDRTDIYSFGMTLYFALSGRSPFEGSGLMAVMHAQVNSMPIPVESISPQLSECPALAKTIDLCIQKDKENRFRNAGQLLEALGFIQNHAKSGETLHISLEKGVLTCKRQGEALRGKPASPFVQSVEKAAPPATAGPPPEEVPTLVQAPPAPEEQSRVIPVVLFLIAATVIAFSFFLFGGDSSPSNAVQQPVAEEKAPQLERLSVTLETDPLEAEVFRNGQFVSATPFTTLLKEGESVVFEVRKEGYVTRSIKLTPDTPKPRLTLVPEATPKKPAPKKPKRSSTRKKAKKVDPPPAEAKPAPAEPEPQKEASQKEEDKRKKDSKFKGWQ
jgi:eukaryotic-like serine/threonine-protein kinase